MKKLKLKFREKVGLTLGVGIVLAGSVLENIERKTGKMSDILLILGIILIFGVIIYVNYGKKH